MKSWISIILALIFLSAVVIFNIKKPTPLPVPRVLPTATPTLSPTPTISSSLCLPAYLQATISFEGAAGTQYGTAKLTNISQHACTLTLNKQLQLIYLPTIKNIKVTYSGSPAMEDYSLQPRASLYALVKIPNGPQCQSPVNPVQASLSYEVVPGQTVTFSNSGKPEFLINACQSEANLTTVQIATLSATPIP